MSHFRTYPRDNSHNFFWLRSQPASRTRPENAWTIHRGNAPSDSPILLPCSHLLYQARCSKMAFLVIDGIEVLLPPPDGYRVNFENPSRDSHTITSSYVAFGTMFPVAFLFLSQRVYTAIFILRKWLIDDSKQDIHFVLLAER